MADVIDYKIYGDDFQAVEIELDRGEGVRAEVGAMLYMEEGIQMDTGTGGGVFKGISRMFTGESFFITSFKNIAYGKQKVVFSAPYPGRIIPIDLGSVGGEFICQKDAFLCSAHGVEISVAFTKRLGIGFFGGEGFILQRLTGDGLVFIHAGGTIIKRELGYNETLRVDTGCLVAFEKSVTYDIKLVGGIKNTLFGGEGLFLTTIKGPGTVYLQSLPFSRIADRIMSASRTGNKGESRNVLSGVLSGILND
ncbi:MAG: TIGR00266 family protein [Candidatus Cloacimonetes bacterium 4572_65]|nr:MAG: TIGR00266 family protein [Candidatus Cloacimonetes bacterium 4572_65]